MQNRHLSKLASARKGVGDSARRTAAHIKVREDLSTDSTPKLPAEVEFGKISSKQQGFTLLEIVIALLIFTVIAGIAAVSLYSVVNASKRIKKHAYQLAELQIVQTLLTRDFSQLIDRPIIDEAGQTQPSVKSLTGNLSGAEFTKIDELNPFALQQQSNLQRVAYFVQQSQLYRQTWQALDRTPDTKTSIQPLLSHITAWQIIFLDANKQAHDYWPLKAEDKNLPRAIIIKLVTRDHGEIDRIFVINGRGFQNRSDNDKASSIKNSISLRQDQNINDEDE